MIRKHREALDLCSEDIVPRINLVNLWPKLLENKIFNRDDVNVPRWTKSLLNVETVRDIYFMIKTRGPFAFDRFLYSLRQSGHDNLAELLERRKAMLRDDRVPMNIIERPQSGTTPRNNERVMETERECDNFFNTMQLTEEPLRVQVRKATTFLDGPAYESVQRYPMRSNPRGLVLIITNIHFNYSDKPPRLSARHDATNLILLFKHMGFQVIFFCDLTGQKLLEKVQEFSRHENLRRVDSCFVIVSSHGNMDAQNDDTEIEGVDYHPDGGVDNYTHVFCSDVMDCFTAEACPHLAGKPKVFIFQLCRGEKKQKAVREPRHTANPSSSTLKSEETVDYMTNNKKTMRNYADMFVAHATMPGYVAFRDNITGSWFIQILCEVFMNYACTMHLQDLFNIIDERLEIQRTKREECQTVMVTSIGFNKHCYINPGLFEDV